MFLPHFAVAFAAKRAAPAVSLGTFFLACQLADIIWPNLVLLGVERVSIVPGITATSPLDFESYPYSHSLVALALWSGLTALVYWLLRPNAAPRALAVIAGVVLSHWVLDAVAHRPDLPIAIGGTRKVGLELWRSRTATLVVEGGLLAAGVWVYLGATRARDRAGSLALWGLLAFLVVSYLASVFGPPPPGAVPVAWTAQAMWLLVVWGYWIDRHRVARSSL